MQLFLFPSLLVCRILNDCMKCTKNIEFMTKMCHFIEMHYWMFVLRVFLLSLVSWSRSTKVKYQSFFSGFCLANRVYKSTHWREEKKKKLQHTEHWLIRLRFHSTAHLIWKNYGAKDKINFHASYVRNAVCFYASIVHVGILEPVHQCIHANNSCTRIKLHAPLSIYVLERIYLLLFSIARFAFGWKREREYKIKTTN